jgi:hypothetical protein
MKKTLENMKVRCTRVFFRTFFFWLFFGGGGGVGWVGPRGFLKHQPASRPAPHKLGKTQPVPAKKHIKTMF